MNLQNQLLHEDRLREIRQELQREALRIEALGSKRRNPLLANFLNSVGTQLVALGERMKDEHAHTAQPGLPAAKA